MSVITRSQSTQPITATITGRSGATYRLTTASGRVLSAQSTETYTIGDPVVVLAGQIIGRAGRPQPSKIYEV
jgi:hypothetical protein